jgi:hypothetical protein
MGLWDRGSVVLAREVGEARIWLVADRPSAVGAVAQATLRRDRLAQLALAIGTSASVPSARLLRDVLSLCARHPSQPSSPLCRGARKEEDRPGERSCQHRTTA